MKIAPPIYLMSYIDFKDGKVVPAKPVPKIFQKGFNRYCKKVEAADKRREEMFNNIAKQVEKEDN